MKDFLQALKMLLSVAEIVDGRLVFRITVDIQDVDGTQLYLTDKTV